MTTHLELVDVGSEPPERYRDVLPRSAYRKFEDKLAKGAEVLRGRTFWHVNSTPQGGGVAEMLRALLPYLRAAGWDARWVVIDGDAEFFDVTKRIHNALHGVDGDGPLGEPERAVYDATTKRNVAELLELVRPGDVALIHDPQTAGLIPALRDAGVGVAWQCHVGTDETNDATCDAWRFLLRDVGEADRLLFTRTEYLWDGLDERRLRIIPPTIDPFTAKNMELDDTEVETILRASGVLEGRPERAPVFARSDGSTGEVRRRVERTGDGAPVPSDARLVVQISRWDKLKDPSGVMELFARRFADAGDVHLVLAGPEVSEVADDPEASEVLEACSQQWAALSEGLRARVHLLTVPMADEEENAVIVNALQRCADVAVQKSLEEGFGLVVTEALWKGRPMVATGVGGIQDQIEHGRTGLLVDDPRDLATFGEAIAELLADRKRAAGMGRAARRHVRDHSIGSRQMAQYARLVEELARVADGRAGAVRGIPA